MTDSRILWLIVLLISTACSRSSSEQDVQLENRSFAYVFFATEKECLDAQPEPDFFYNCHQQVDFLKNNAVEIMLSDVIWRGIYTTENNLIILTFQPNYEIPDGEIIFYLLKKYQLIRTENNTLWKEITGKTIWD